MEKLNLFIPQWQGSGTDNELYIGAHTLRNFIEQNSPCTFEHIPISETETSEIKNDILGFDILISQIKIIEQTLKEREPEKIFTVGGGCDIEIPTVSYFNHRHDDLTLFWFDAHGDLNSPQSSPSKLLHGMPLRFLTDKNTALGDIEIHHVPPEKVNLLGSRDFDAPEIRYIQENGIEVISVRDILDNESFLRRIRSKAGNAYIHIDLDVLDPRYYPYVKCPTDTGLSISALTRAVEEIKAQCHVVGYSIVENTETEMDKLKVLQDIIESCIHM